MFVTFRSSYLSIIFHSLASFFFDNPSLAIYIIHCGVNRLPFLSHLVKDNQRYFFHTISPWLVWRLSLLWFGFVHLFLFLVLQQRQKTNRFQLSISFLNFAFEMVTLSFGRLKNTTASLFVASSDTFRFFKFSLYQSSASLFVGRASWCWFLGSPIITELTKIFRATFGNTLTFL